MDCGSRSNRLRVDRSKAYLISQALEDAQVDAASSALGLDGFKKLIGHGKKRAMSDETGMLLLVTYVLKKKKKKKGKE